MQQPPAQNDDQSQAVAIARELLGRAPRAARLASNNNAVFRLDFPGGLPSKVIKLAGRGDRAAASIRREQRTLHALAALGLCVPNAEFTQDALTGAERPFTIMPLLPGDTLERAAKADAPWAAEGCRWAGAFVRQLARVPIAALRAGELSAAGAGMAPATVRERFATEGMLHPPFSTVIDHAERLLGLPARQLLHGDYAWNQIITDGTRYAVIDWETVAVGDGLDMLGRAVAMVREYGGRQANGPVGEQIDWMVEGYAAGQTLSESDLRDLHLWEMWHHVGCMAWKFVCGPDHRGHAFAMAERVKAWAHV